MYSLLAVGTTVGISREDGIFPELSFRDSFSIGLLLLIKLKEGKCMMHFEQRDVSNLGIWEIFPRGGSSQRLMGMQNHYTSDLALHLALL